MTYQRFSGARVSVVASVIVATLLPRQQADRVLEDAVEHRDVQADGEADGKDQDGQVARLLGCRPADLPQFGPRFVDEAANATHVGCSSLSSLLATVLAVPPPRAEAAVLKAIRPRICGRGDRTR